MSDEPQWSTRLQESAGVVHRCPALHESVTPCCGRTPFELLDARMTVHDDLVTCGRSPAPWVPEARYWLGCCPDPDGGEPSTLRMRLREAHPGQFDAVPYEPFEVPCWLGDHESHTMRPCSREEYEADDY